MLFPFILGLAHGLADTATGFLIGSLPASAPFLNLGLLVVLFNALAFGSQPLVGLLTDRIRRPRAMALGGLVLHSIALLSIHQDPTVAVVLAGIGSAVFHVGGGALVLGISGGRATGPALFAAPGVAGVAVGGAAGMMGISPHWILAPLVLLTAAVGLYRLPMSSIREQPQQNTETLFDHHDLIMLVLLMAIALRSLVWTAYQFVLQGQMEIIVALGIAAAIGKILGGVLGDRFGWRRTAMTAMLGASLLLTFGNESSWTLLIGMALLQSATPITLAAVAQTMPGKPATASGLALGLAIAAGGIPPISGLSPLIHAPPVSFLLTISVMLAMGWALHRRRMVSTNNMDKISRLS